MDLIRTFQLSVLTEYIFSYLELKQRRIDMFKTLKWNTDRAELPVVMIAGRFYPHEDAVALRDELNLVLTFGKREPDHEAVPENTTKG